MPPGLNSLLALNVELAKETRECWYRCASSFILSLTLGLVVSRSISEPHMMSN